LRSIVNHAIMESNKHAAQAAKEVTL